jgi:hypothetical protein
MSAEILTEIAKQLPGMDDNIKKAEDLIKFMDDAHENTVDLKKNLLLLKQRRQYWYGALKARGLVK